MADIIGLAFKTVADTDGYRRPIVPDGAGLPDHIAFIQDENPRRAWASMADAVCSAPVNGAVWSSLPRELHAQVLSGFKELMHEKAPFSPDPVSFTKEEILREDAVGLRIFFNDVAAQIHAMPLSLESRAGLALWAERQREIIECARGLWPGRSLNVKYGTGITEFAHKNDFHPHIDGEFSAQAVHLVVEKRPMRVFGTHFGPGTLLIDNQDVVFQHRTDMGEPFYDDFQMVNPTPDLHEVQPFDMVTITDKYWPHPPLVHAFAVRYSGEQRMARMTSDFQFGISA